MFAARKPALTEMQQQVAVLQARFTAKEASSRKYKEAVRALKVSEFVSSDTGPAAQMIAHSNARRKAQHTPWSLGLNDKCATWHSLI